MYPEGKRDFVSKIFGSLVSGSAFVAFAALLVSPMARQLFETWPSRMIQEKASVYACDLRRDGQHRMNAIRCSINYEYDGQRYTSQTNVWSSESPFATTSSLDRTLREQSASANRTIQFEPWDPRNVAVVEARWLDSPARWVWMSMLFAGLLGLGVRVMPATTMYRRASMVRDPASGELVESGRARTRRIIAAGGRTSLLTLVAVLGCLYCLSNRAGNTLLMAALPGLQETPATLVGCEPHYRGSTKGNYKIECGFEYRFNGQTFQGQAESIDFRWLPTKTRMSDIAASLNQSNIVAHVDPRHPSYAIAFISNDWFVPYSWGLFELLFVALTLGVLVYLMGARVIR